MLLVGAASKVDLQPAGTEIQKRRPFPIIKGKLIIPHKLLFLQIPLEHMTVANNLRILCGPRLTGHQVQGSVPDAAAILTKGLSRVPKLLCAVMTR